jgi:hypothetical protein
VFNTPILLLIFNRPGPTQSVFDKIREQRPKYLYIASDGPRGNHPADMELNKKCKDIVSDIDWDCQVKTLFRHENLGCGAAPASAISWFFEQVEAGIILEDDCLPNDSFFSYCEQLLEKYRDDKQVMMICGTSYQPVPLNTDTYYFSKYPHVWGWASWKRAWAQYNFKLDTENDHTRAAVINATFTDSHERRFWVANMKMIINGLDAWDYQWMYWIWKHQGVCITPWRNMISNIGFGKHATHTLDASSGQAAMPQYEISAIRHAAGIKVNKAADKYERYHILIDSNAKRYKNKLRSGLTRIKNILLVNNGQ